jgi:hypothetical protein
MDHQPSDMSGDGLLQTDSGHSSQKGQNGTNVDGDIALDVSLPFSSQSNPQQP